MSKNNNKSALGIASTIHIRICSWSTKLGMSKCFENCIFASGRKKGKYKKSKEKSNMKDERKGHLLDKKGLSYATSKKRYTSKG